MMPYHYPQPPEDELAALSDRAEEGIAKKKKRAKKQKKQKRSKRGRASSARKSKRSSSSSSASYSASDSGGEDEEILSAKIPRAFSVLGFTLGHSLPRKKRLFLLRGLLSEDKILPCALGKMSTKQIDQLIFVATKCGPYTSLGDLKAIGVRTYGQLLQTFKKESSKTQRAEAISQLDEELSNVEQCAVTAGWDYTWDRKYSRPKSETKESTATVRNLVITLGPFFFRRYITSLSLSSRELSVIRPDMSQSL